MPSTQERSDEFSGMPLWQKIIGLIMTFALLFVAVGVVWVVVDWAITGSDTEADGEVLSNRWGPPHCAVAPTA